VLLGILGGVVQAAEAARVVEAQAQARFEQQVELIVLQARGLPGSSAQAARHAQVQDQRAALEPQQQVLGAPADRSRCAGRPAAPASLPRSASAAGDRRCAARDAMAVGRALDAATRGFDLGQLGQRRVSAPI
jgi:hypothetical protein